MSDGTPAGPPTALPLLASVAELKRRLNTNQGDTEDQLLTELLESASERVTELAGRQFLPLPASDGDLPVTVTVSAFRSRICRAHDLRNLEVITADGVDVTDSVRLIRARLGWPAHQIRLPYRADQVNITGWFGFETVPPSIRDAVLGWAQRSYHEIRSRMADSTIDPDSGIQNYFRSVPLMVSQPVESFRVAGL